MKNALVAYFSASGVTARLAKTLAQAAQADLFELEPVQPYTNADLDWQNAASRSSVEMKDAASRPEIARRIEHMEQYDTVFVGFPIWWYQAPRIIETFLESYDFSGKTVIPFATSGGSGMGKTVGILRPRCAAAAWMPGKVFGGSASVQTLRSWMDGFR